ncbi:25S rRNA adenine-N(1) methyltransferase [Mycena venus]|uniref:25S rRNA adenine-N(1) methyltransferase n=1 Tax=Mycena venus TaxID=2733690 RepID=A0A8H6XCL3_9AGAR|nr:25S rRNA adenine-N(1) methyltransferase [Mycena venus]
MGKVRKKKTPVTAASATVSSSSSKPESSRKVIRQYHVLLKQQAQLEALPLQKRDAKTVQALEDIRAQIEDLGGLEFYQRMSAIGQGHDRGGGSEKVAISWLKDVYRADSRADSKPMLNLLEVGALKPDNYDLCRSWIKTTPLDLHSRHPSILEQDFLLMDETENREKWDVVSLSLVLNFVSDAKDRGRMLRLAWTFLVPGGHLFLALPLPCVMNSRYLTCERLTALMDAVGFSQLKERWKAGGKMIYVLYQKRAQIAPSSTEFFAKKVSEGAMERAARPQEKTVCSSGHIHVVALTLATGLVLFSGDVFSPSVESSVTRGSHMVPVMNELNPDVSLAGNHDFDFGYPHLSKLMEATKFPWLLSNIVDKATGQVPKGLSEFQVFERAGEWIGTVATWPANFQYKDMKEVGLDLSERLRGEHECDLVISLTHCRVPNDISLAKDLLALSPSAQAKNSVASSHGVDLILGGHDHLYYASKGMSAWEDYDITQDVLGAEADHGDVLVCKSGTDFRDLSEITLELETTTAGSIRKKVISRISGKKHSTKPGSKSSEKLTEILKTVLSSVSSTLKAPVCNSAVAMDSAAGNWFADVIRHAYDDTLAMKGCGGADGVFVCAGTFRGDSIYGPGQITLGDILEILPFEDPIVVLELDGNTIWDALEASLATWPAQEGRFPVISGFRVSWDSRRSPGERVLGVWLLNEVEESDSGHDPVSGHSTPSHRLVDGEPIQRTTDKTYKIVTRSYMAEGHDGFTALQRGEPLVDDEGGQIYSAIVRKYLMGSHYVNTMARLTETDVEHLHSTTKAAIGREKAKQGREQHRSKIASQWKHVAHLAVRWSRSRTHYQDHLNVCHLESMHSVDPFNGEKMRRGEECAGPQVNEKDDDLLTVSSSVDGRLKDEGR